MTSVPWHNRNRTFLGSVFGSHCATPRRSAFPPFSNQRMIADMDRREKLHWEMKSAIVGAVAAAMTAGAVAWLTKSSPWLPVISGTILGALAGAFGQNLIEGIVMATIGTGILALLVYAPSLPWWVREIAIGFFAGGSTGWIVHGYFDLRNRP